MLFKNNIKSYKDINLIGIVFSSTLVGSQCFKILFNLFGETYIPSDKWTVMEFLSAVVNIITFTILSNLQVDDIKITSRKEYYDILVIFVVVFTWFRFFTFFLIIKGVSRHFITIYKMIKHTLGFIFLVFSYLIFMSIVFMLLYKEYSIEMYFTFPMSIRMMCDYMTGNFGRGIPFDREEDTHTVITIFHLLMSKILLTNFIIAMLMTVYNSMNQKGDFTYKSNRYEYIERYQIALRDGWGYSELVTIPAPLNVTMVVTLPWILNKPMFKKAADTIGKLFFWIENLAYMAFLW